MLERLVSQLEKLRASDLGKPLVVLLLVSQGRLLVESLETSLLVVLVSVRRQQLGIALEFLHLRFPRLLCQTPRYSHTPLLRLVALVVAL